ncbi:hypothetical protein DCC62_13145 [candidate division KSB1 bacterium]|nr:MAG: hypothetical protein DCC62_13145 [candidate division KSB1 bacterium]
MAGSDTVRFTNIGQHRRRGYRLAGKFLGFGRHRRPIVESFPEYPPAARKARAQGVVELRVKVDETGKVVQVIVLNNATQNEACAQAAINAAFRSRYRPAQTAAGPDTAWIVRPYRFSLNK